MGFLGRCLAAIALCLLLPAGAAAQKIYMHGLWWAAPAGSQSGWGISFEDQASYILAVWYTYDAARRPTWLVATLRPVGAELPSTQYVGDLFHVRGPPFREPVFDESRVVRTRIGTLRLDIAGEDQATLTARFVGGLTVTAPITRQVFDRPLPVCRGFGPLVRTTDNMTSLFEGRSADDRNESGWGVFLQHQGRRLFAVWFTYDEEGRPTWFVAPDVIYPGAIGSTSAVLYQTSGPPLHAMPWPPAEVSARPVGEMRLDTEGIGRATMHFRVGHVTGSRPIQRHIIAGLTNTRCRFEENP